MEITNAELFFFDDTDEREKEKDNNEDKTDKKLE